MRLLIPLIVCAFFLAGCHSAKESDCIPKDGYEATDWLDDNLLLQTKALIAANDIGSPRFRELKLWLAEKWMISEWDAGKILDEYRKYLRSTNGKANYDFESVYDQTNHFAFSSSYLFFDYDRKNIPVPEIVCVRNYDLPFVSLRITEDDKSYINSHKDRDLIAFLSYLHRCDKQLIIDLNDLDPQDVNGDIKKRNKLIFIRLEYPDLYAPVDKAQDEHFDRQYHDQQNIGGGDK